MVGVRRVVMTAVLVAAVPRIAAGADGSAAEAAARLATLRAEVEALAQDVDAEKEEHKTRIRGLMARRAELEIDRQRERVRLAAILKARAAKRQAGQAAEARNAALKPAVLKAIETVRAHVNASIPFRREERLADLDGLQKRVIDGVLTPVDAFSRLWETIEAEVRMAGESVLDRQPLTVNGAERLVDVVRVGTVGMAWRAPDGACGTVRRTAQRWITAAIADPAVCKAVTRLHDSFRKQLRVGRFALPDLLPEGAAK